MRVIELGAETTKPVFTITRSDTEDLFIPVWPLGALQELSGAGAINITGPVTHWTTTGADAGTLADGDLPHLMKRIQLVVDGGDGTLTPATFADGTTITFADVGDFVDLRWTTSGWTVHDKGNLADGTSAPAIA